ncbi:MAG: wax ester/triacylglycerol synthase family O-acyltransferase [Mobilicoccus sp.]|nr:wax ester/triacylglycerol synthase family O-acyltransferase [Mobilicoccus sp.]
MPDRLSALDASFLYLEEPTTAMHVGSVMILEAGDLDYDRLVAIVSDRIGEFSRYRQRVRELPGRISGPVWVDDVAFDITYHVRRSALPAPGLDEQLDEFVARIQSRALDRQHPLWEIYLVEGLAGDRVAIVTKTHQALVDGVTAVDIGHLLLDDRPDIEVPPLREWEPRREPGDVSLVADAVAGFARRPLTLVERIRGGLLGGTVGIAQRALDRAGSVVTQVARTAASPAPASALNTRVGAPRRYRTLRTDLAAYRAVREAMAGGDRPVDVSVTDVVLTVLTGGIRTWLQSHGEPVHSATTVRAMVPVSIAEQTRAEVRGGLDADVEPGQAGVSQVAAVFVDLPVGETSPRVRLERIAYQTRHQAGSSRAVPAGALAGLAGFAPPTLHVLGARVGHAMSRRMFNLVVTNVPGPQRPLYVGGARMVATYPVMPLTTGHALAVGVTSYDGEVFIGLNGDRASMTDLDVLAEGVTESLDEMCEAVGVEGARG